MNCTSYFFLLLGQSRSTFGFSRVDNHSNCLCGSTSSILDIGQKIFGMLWIVIPSATIHPDKVFYRIRRPFPKRICPSLIVRSIQGGGIFNAGGVVEIEIG